MNGFMPTLAVWLVLFSFMFLDSPDINVAVGTKVYFDSDVTPCFLSTSQASSWWECQITGEQGSIRFGLC